MSAQKRLARTAGLLYLTVAVFAGFAFGYVLTKVYVPGDAATTAAKVLANAGLVRLGVVADLAQATVMVFVAMTLYRLLKHVNENAASAMVVFAAIAATIMCLNDVFQIAALLVATSSSYVAAFGTQGANALVLLLLDIHHWGYLIAQIFFGLWLIPMGYLAYKSAMFPKLLGGVLIVAGGCYLVDMVAQFLAPDFAAKIHTFVARLGPAGIRGHSGRVTAGSDGVQSEFDPHDSRRPLGDLHRRVADGQGIQCICIHSPACNRQRGSSPRGAA